MPNPKSTLLRVADSLRHWADTGRMFLSGPEAKECAAELEEMDAALNVAAGASSAQYDPTYGDNRLCLCGHPYYRHFTEGHAGNCVLCPCEGFTDAD